MILLEGVGVWKTNNIWELMVLARFIKSFLLMFYWKSCWRTKLWSAKAYSLLALMTFSCLSGISDSREDLACSLWEMSDLLEVIDDSFSLSSALRNSLV